MTEQFNEKSTRSGFVQARRLVVREEALGKVNEYVFFGAVGKAADANLFPKTK